MRITAVLVLFLFALAGTSSADETIADWKNGWADESYVTTAKMTSDAEVRIRVVECPDSGNGLVVWKVSGNADAPGSVSTPVKRWDNITKGQILKVKLTGDDVIKVSSVPVAFAKCAGLERRDGYHLMTLNRMGQVWKLEIKVVSKF